MALNEVAVTIPLTTIPVELITIISEPGDIPKIKEIETYYKCQISELPGNFIVA